MSTTAELRELTTELVEALGKGPHAALARRVAEAAEGVAQKVEAAYTAVVNGAGPALSAACFPAQDVRPSPIQAAPSA